MPKVHPQMLRERRVSVDRRVHSWAVKDYANGTIAGRVELRDDTFTALRVDGQVVGVFDNLTQARQALVPAKRKPALTSF